MKCGGLNLICKCFIMWWSKISCEGNLVNTWVLNTVFLEYHYFFFKSLSKIKSYLWCHLICFMMDFTLRWIWSLILAFLKCLIEIQKGKISNLRKSFIHIFDSDGPQSPQTHSFIHHRNMSGWTAAELWCMDSLKLSVDMFSNVVFFWTKADWF